MLFIIYQAGVSEKMGISGYNRKRNQSVMDVIVRANPELFREEAEDMCEALMELMKDKFEEKFEEFGL